MTWSDFDSSVSLLFPSLSSLCGHFSFSLLASPPFIGSDLSAPKKCRARFGLDQQNNWCGPCRCVSGVLASMLEQVTAGKLYTGNSSLCLPLVSLYLSPPPSPPPFHATPYATNQLLLPLWSWVMLTAVMVYDCFLCGGALEWVSAFKMYADFLSQTGTVYVCIY